MVLEHTHTDTHSQNPLILIFVLMKSQEPAHKKMTGAHRPALTSQAREDREQGLT